MFLGSKTCLRSPSDTCVVSVNLRWRWTRMTFRKWTHPSSTRWRTWRSSPVWMRPLCCTTSRRDTTLGLSMWVWVDTWVHVMAPWISICKESLFFSWQILVFRYSLCHPLSLTAFLLHFVRCCLPPFWGLIPTTTFSRRSQGCAHRCTTYCWWLVWECPFI